MGSVTLFEVFSRSYFTTNTSQRIPVTRQFPSSPILPSSPHPGDAPAEGPDRRLRPVAATPPIQNSACRFILSPHQNSFRPPFFCPPATLLHPRAWVCDHRECFGVCGVNFSRNAECSDHQKQIKTPNPKASVKLPCTANIFFSVPKQNIAYF